MKKNGLDSHHGISLTPKSARIARTASHCAAGLRPFLDQLLERLVVQGEVRDQALELAAFILQLAEAPEFDSAPEDLAELKGRLRNSVRRIRGSQKLLWSCIYASDLPWTR